jgi:hypothetical protein
MPRFVVLEHDQPELHWDLMLEGDGVLRTWRLGAPPEPGKTVRATPSFDHRLVYLDYEGPISGGRGCVRRWDRGTFSCEVDTNARLVVHAAGERLRGRIVLMKTTAEMWMLTADEGIVGDGHGQGAAGQDQGPGEGLPPA